MLRLRRHLDWIGNGRVRYVGKIAEELNALLVSAILNTKHNRYIYCFGPRQESNGAMEKEPNSYRHMPIHSSQRRTPEPYSSC
jgi:hypothetical protein